MKTANELHERPQWYNELCSNCTTNVRLDVKDIGYARPWDWQILINGFIAERAYELWEIDTSLPFPELKRLSYTTIAPARRTTIPISRASSGKVFRECPEFQIGKMAIVLEAIGLRNRRI